MKPITLTVEWEDKTETYELNFNRSTAKWAEQNGFNVGNITPSAIYDLFFYSFRMNHKNVAREKTDRIIDEFFGGIGYLPEGMIERLAELYTNCYETLTEEQREAKKSKVKVVL